jgi:hypothetical protein
MEQTLEYIAFLLFLIAASSETGFKFVQILVKIVRWFDMNILGMDYQSFWFAVFVIPFLVVAILAVIALFKIANQFKRYNDSREKQPTIYPDEDLYDKAARP